MFIENKKSKMLHDLLGCFYKNKIISNSLKTLNIDGPWT